jgi:hypothetical protein
MVDFGGSGVSHHDDITTLDTTDITCPPWYYFYHDPSKLLVDAKSQSDPAPATSSKLTTPASAQQSRKTFSGIVLLSMDLSL